MKRRGLYSPEVGIVKDSVTGFCYLDTVLCASVLFNKGFDFTVRVLLPTSPFNPELPLVQFA